MNVSLKIKRGLLSLLAVITLSSSIVAGLPMHVLAYDGNSPLYAGKSGDGDMNDLGGGSAADAKIAKNVSVSFEDIGHLDVQVNIDEALFSKQDIDAANPLTYNTAFSGKYYMSPDSSEWYSNPITVRKDGESFIYVTGIIKSVSGSVPNFKKASAADIQNWVSKGFYFYPTVYAYNSGDGDASQLFVLAHENQNQTGLSWHNHCFFSSVFSSTGSSCDVVNHQDNTNVYFAFHASDTFANRGDYTSAVLKNVDTKNAQYLYTYSNDAIVGDVPGVAAAVSATFQANIDRSKLFPSYTFCSGPDPKYFQLDKCGGNGDVIFSNSWKGKSAADVKALFDVDAAVPASLGDSSQKNPIDIQVLGAKTKSAATVGAQGSAAGTSADSANTCETSGPTLSWIFCAVINGLSSVTQNIFTGVIEPYLKESPIDTSAGTAANPNPVYQVWAAMRNIADIVLVFALLAVVFGQSIGGGLIDAYTAKKALPRILVAAVLINLSLFIVAGLVDLFNVIGAGIGDLIIGPFRKTILAKFQTSGGTNAAGALLGVGALIGLIITVVLLHGTKEVFQYGGAVQGVQSIGRTLMPFVQFLLVFVLVPAVLITLAIFSVLIIRRGLIMILIVVAPVAFALFAIPQTDKYFKKWWKMLVETLLVYPIITIIFAVASVLAAISYNTNDTSGGALSGFLAAIVALIICFIPLVLIPFAFKIAGGVIGSVFETAQGYGKRISEANKGNANDPNSRRNRVKHNAASQWTRSRAGFVRSTRNNRGVTGFLGRRMNYGDVMSKEAAINEEGIKRMQQVKNTGDDTFGRALTSIPLFMNPDGSYTETDTGTRAVKDGNLMRRTLGGKLVTENDYNKGNQLYKTQGERQAWADYEATKIGVGDTEDYKRRYLQWGTQMGFTKDEMNGVYTGIAFARQNERLNLKYSAIDGDATKGFKFADVEGDTMNYKPATGELGKNDEMINDMYYKKGSYAQGQLSAEDMNRVYDIKEHLANKVQQLNGVDRFSMDPHQLAQHDRELSNSQLRLQQISGMEDGWAGVRDPSGSGVIPGVTPGTQTDGDGTPMYSGLSGANQGIQDAFKKRAYREETASDGSPVKVLNKIDPATGLPVPVGARAPRSTPPPPSSGSGGVSVPPGFSGGGGSFS